MLRKSVYYCDINLVFFLDLEETVDKASVQRDEQEPAPEEAFDLQKYVDKLKEEIAAWHDVSNERKDEHHKLAKKKAEIKKSGQEADLNLLTEDERKFIDDRPNLDHLMSSGKDLLDLSVKIVQLNQHYIRRYDYLQSLIERRINEAKEKIISLID